MSATQQIMVSLQRTWEGLKLTVKLNPRIEEFFKSRAEGGVSEALTGRYWRSPDRLNVYNIPPELTGSRSLLRTEYHSQYRLDRPGDRLTLGSPDVVNMSFLRLVGASEGDGVSFVVPGVWDEETMLTFQKGVEAANDTFYRTFLKPVRLVTILSTMEREGGSGEFKEVRPSN